MFSGGPAESISAGRPSQGSAMTGRFWLRLGFAVRGALIVAALPWLGCGRVGYEPVGETICTPFTGARGAEPVPGVAVNVNVAAVRFRNTM